MKDDFTFEHTYDKGLLSLDIDLSKVNPSLAGSEIEGELAIWNMAHENVTYGVDFTLICTNKDKCKQESAFKGVEIETIVEKIKEEDSKKEEEPNEK